MPLTGALAYDSSVSACIVRMDRFTCDVDMLPDEYRFLIQLKEKDGCVGETYYSVSEEYFRKVGLDKEAVDHFAHQIAEQLVAITNKSRHS